MGRQDAERREWDVQSKGMKQSGLRYLDEEVVKSMSEAYMMLNDSKFSLWN
jgi:hypothetical protein